MKKTILSALLLFITAIMAQAQNITVHGTVLSKTDDEPLIGASVLCETTKAGAATDFDGNFQVSVPSGAVLTISYVGFKTVTVAAEPQMTVYLEEDTELLDEVVVVGYQTVRKADLTGAVSVVSTKALETSPDTERHRFGPYSRYRLLQRFSGPSLCDRRGTDHSHAEFFEYE